MNSMWSRQICFDLNRLRLNDPCQNGLIRLERSLGRTTGKLPVLNALKLWKHGDILYSDVLWGFKILDNPIEMILRWVPVLGACKGLEHMSPGHAVVWLQQRVSEVLSGRSQLLYSEWLASSGPGWVDLDVPEFGVQVELELIEELMEWCR